MISKLSAKYQLCAIHTADTIDGEVHRIRESPSFIPARLIGYSVLTGGVVNRVRGIYVLPAGVRGSLPVKSLFSVSVSACYCIPQCVRLIAGDWCLHVVD